ncbi:MAG TPA: helix-turn-helix transcriptional regulator [Blastocatellia bacterium]|nr:helix-turn-helix transcriptional regulator [Blastocatellia bacterium]
MIRLRIREAAKAKGIETAYQLQKIADLHPGHAARLWKGDLTQIGLNTLESLCEALDCDPADLIVRVNAKRRRRKPTPSP